MRAGSSVGATCPGKDEAEDKIKVEAATKKGRRTMEKTEHDIASEYSFHNLQNRRPLVACDIGQK